MKEKTEENYFRTVLTLILSKVKMQQMHKEKNSKQW